MVCICDWSRDRWGRRPCEFHFNQGEQWDRLFKTGASVDLSNWRLAKAVDFVFPAGTTIAAGGYIVIAENPVTLNALYGGAALGPWVGGLSSDGDEIELRDAGGVTVDKVTFGNTAP